MNPEPHYAVRVTDVSKKYCRQLKRSLRYGLVDLMSEFSGRAGHQRGRLRRGEFFAVDHVSFDIQPGQCVALLGKNGAGKSTLLKLIAGLFKPDTGSIRVRGRLGALIELGTGFNPILSGRENVFVNGTLLGLSKPEIQQRFDAIVDFAELEPVIDEPVRTYSSGMRLRLGFAVAAFLRPHVLLIDEVLAVGDVGFRMKCFKHILDLVEQGLALIIVSHAIGQLNRVASRSILMHDHKLLFDGPFTEGAALYEKLLITEEPSLPQPRTRQTASIDSIQVQNRATGNNLFQTGESLRAEIQLACTEPIRDARVRVFIESPRSGVLGGFSTKYQDVRLDLEPPGKLLVLEMPDLPLLMGGYSLNVALYGASLEDFLDRRQPGAGFEIVGPKTDSFARGLDGLIRFDHRWQVLDIHSRRG